MKPRRVAGLGQIMTATEVAQYFGIHQRTLEKLARDGQIPGFRVGSLYRFARGAIEKWMAEEQGKKNFRRT